MDASLIMPGRLPAVGAPPKRERPRVQRGSRRDGSWREGFGAVANATQCDCAPPVRAKGRARPRAQRACVSHRRQGRARARPRFLPLRHCCSLSASHRRRERRSTRENEQQRRAGARPAPRTLTSRSFPNVSYDQRRMERMHFTAAMPLLLMRTRRMACFPPVNATNDATDGKRSDAIPATPRHGPREMGAQTINGCDARL
jgi:hypothetical protein